VENGNLEDITIAVIYQNTSINFFQLLAAGVVGANEELPITAYATGPATADVNEQVNIIESLIISEIDGIVTDIINPEALNVVIDKAMEAGIPVVTFNSDADGSRRMAFHGQDLVQSGITNSEVLVEYMGTDGKVLVMTGDIAAAWSQDRVSGNEQVLNSYDTIEILDYINAGAGGWEEQAIYTDVENALRSYPEVTGIVSMDAMTTPAVGRAILRNELTSIYHVGHDLLPETLENIAAGATNASLSQNPYNQGFAAVDTLYEFIVNGVAPEYVDTGVLRVDESNVQEYLDKLEAGEPVG
jgi:simple sugar transport system substrate-binding protein/ribose transport system substrate-binding protein